MIYIIAIVLVPIGLYFLYKVFKEPTVGICALAFVVPLDGLTQIIPNAFTLSKLVAALLFFKLIYDGFSSKLRVPREKNTTLRLFLFYPFLGVIFLLLSGSHIQEGLLDVFINTQIISLILICYIYIKTPDQLKKVVLWMVLGSALVGAATIFLGDSLLEKDSGRLGMGTNENALAFTLSIPFIIGFLIFDKTKGMAYNSGALFCLLLILYAILLTGSRGMIFAIGGAFLVTVIFPIKLAIKYRLAVLIVFGFVISSFIYIYYLNFFPEINSVVDARIRASERGGVDASRGWIWKYYLEEHIYNNPWGIGPGFPFYNNLFPHNEYLKIALDYGFLGLLYFTCITILLIRNVLKIADQRITFFLIALLLFLGIAAVTNEIIQTKSFALSVSIVLMYTRFSMLKQRLQKIENSNSLV